MARMTEISYERVRYLGNFESARVTLTACLANDDEIDDTLMALRVKAREFLWPKKGTPDHDTRDPITRKRRGQLVDPDEQKTDAEKDGGLDY